MQTAEHPFNLGGGVTHHLRGAHASTFHFLPIGAVGSSVYDTSRESAAVSRNHHQHRSPPPHSRSAFQFGCDFLTPAVWVKRALFRRG